MLNAAGRPSSFLCTKCEPLVAGTAISHNKPTNHASSFRSLPVDLCSHHHRILLPNSPSTGPSPSLRFGITHSGARVFWTQRRNGFAPRALKSRGKGRDLELDDAYESSEEFGCGAEGDDGDEEDEMYLPFGRMEKWLEDKPRGFGAGKVYDTSIEDKLLEEMRQSRVAQAANLDKLKNDDGLKPSPKKDQPWPKVTEALATGIRVRVANLPKKKNIHRDLKFAFVGVKGITSIHPAVSGNKMTRDPICMGFAFIYFRSEEDAISFVQTFSRRTLTFGKVQKQIRCEMLDPQLVPISNEKSAISTLMSSESTTSDMDEEQDVHTDIDGPWSDSWENDASENEDDLADELVRGELQDMRESMKSFSLSDADDSESTDTESEAEFVTASFTSEQQRGKTRATKQGKKRLQKLPAKKGQGEKVPKLVVPGSAKKLKMREKAVLTGVLSKYGGQSLTSNDA